MKIRRLTYVIILGCFFLRPFSFYSQKQEDFLVADSIENESIFERAVNLGEDVLDWVTWENKYGLMSLYPAGGYSERTGLEIGVMMVYQLKSIDTTGHKYLRPTTFTPRVQFSTKGMVEIATEYEIYSTNGWIYSGKLKYEKIDDHYFGIGDESGEQLFKYQRKQLYWRCSFLKGLSDRFFMGVNIDLTSENHQPKDQDYFGSQVLGADGGLMLGIGPELIYDTRDNLNYPSDGVYVGLNGLWYNDDLGDYNFFSSLFDVREYESIGNNTGVILANQALINMTHGDVPFYKLSMLGGKKAVRGIGHSQRYINSHMYLLQSEIRKLIWWRIGGVLFGGCGNAFEDGIEAIQSPHWFGGGGLRFQALPNRKLNLRMDYGVTNKGDSGFFITIGEAF